ncbi:MAG: DEAD/DEAH box helicase [bacterium]
MTHKQKHKPIPTTDLKLSDFLTRLESDDRFAREIAHHEVIEGLPARYAPLDPQLPEGLANALRAEGIEGLYTHQVEAIRLAREGKHVVSVTPTASGKSLSFLLPILEALQADPQSRALLLFPIKALAQDQFKHIRDLLAAAGMGEVRIEIYDGDTPAHHRAKIRQNPPQILLTNPDMIHHGILPFHQQWEGLLENLKFVVVDELHGYKGIFGSHVLQVLHRLRRVAAFHRSRPQFLAASATIANPGELAYELTGLPFEVVEASGAARAARHFLFMNPTASLYTTAVKLLTDSVHTGLKTIVFTKARKMTELIHNWTIQSAPELAGRISAYRAGYLPSERREIEKALQSGELDGVIATSALEMGIDIGGLDVAVLVGYPGSISATWQRGGRAGRRDRDSAIFLLALPDALDQYFMRHPSDFFARPVEAAVVDAGNPFLLRSHLLCAAQELPLRLDDPTWPKSISEPAIRELARDGELLEAAGGAVFFPKAKQPQRNVDIRGGGDTFSIFEETSHKLIGKVSGWQALTECHEGAIYLHHGQSFLVDRLDLATNEVFVRRANVAYYTQARTSKDTEILEVYDSRENDRYRLFLGKLHVTETVTGYEKRSTASREKLSEHELDLPPLAYDTIGTWFMPTDEAIAGLLEEKRHPMGSLHAAEHASLALLPLFALCDRNDLGGISFTRHVQAGGAAVFLYDGHPGGVGLANRAYKVMDELLERVLHLIEECECEEGCPSCIHSPKCGNGNQPLDKAGSIRLLQHLTGGAELMGDTAMYRQEFPEGHHAQTESFGTLLTGQPGHLGIGTTVYVSKLPLTKGRDIVVFDLETQLSAEEVGGWHNAHLMKLALAVTYERRSDTFATWYEKDAEELVHRLAKAELVVGYNHKKFDYAVLIPYVPFDKDGIPIVDFRALPSLDLLEELTSSNGFRAKLADVAAATVGATKTADGLQSLQWWKEGKVDLIEEYCRMDVKLTAQLFDHALEHGHVLLDRKDQGVVRVPLVLPLEKLLA